MELRCKKVRYQLKDDDGLNNTGFLLCMTDCQAIDNCVMDGLSFIVNLKREVNRCKHTV